MSSFIDNLSPPLDWKLYEGRLSLLGSLLYLWSQEGSLAHSRCSVSICKMSESIHLLNIYSPPTFTMTA